jgi:trimethylamine--corrinoid protein Co-methyltransferase
MARVVAGGSEALRRRPIVSSFQCSISPLSYAGDVMEAAVEFAEAGLPCGFVAMAIGTATAPTTLAGHLVTVNAELLGGIATLETLVPGAATYYGPYQAFMDLQSGGIDLAWGPEEFLFKLAAAQLARRYELPMNILGFGTGAKTQDWQAGAQHAIALMGIAVAGEADMIAATGTVYGGRVFAFENVLLDAELFDLTCHLLESIGVDDEALAFDAIQAVGPGGHFLAQAHTRAHMRELWMPRFFGRDTWEEWEGAGRPEPRDLAHERVQQILAEHEPEPLDEDVERELLRIIDSHQKEGAHHG